MRGLSNFILKSFKNKAFYPSLVNKNFRKTLPDREFNSHLTSLLVLSGSKRTNSTNDLLFYLFAAGAALSINSAAHAEEKESNIENSAFQIYLDNIQEYIKQQNLTPLTPTEIKQLYAVQTNTQFTPQAAVRYNGKHPWVAHLHRDVQRTIVRIHFLEILSQQKNALSAYEEFTQHQEDKCSLSEFKKLKDRFEKHSSEQTKALRVATIIQAITLSPQILKKAQASLPVIEYDSVRFSCQTAQLCPKIYDIWPEDDKTQSWVKTCFPYDKGPQLHLRHIYFSEGNKGMWEFLRKKIVAREMTSQQLDFWIDYWYLDLIGFEGHINSKKPYLNKQVLEKIQTITNTLHHLFIDPSYNVLANYFIKEQERLDLKNHALELKLSFPDEVYLLATHLALMLNLSSKDDAKIKGLLLGLSTVKNLDLLAQKYASYIQKCSLTTTYQPAFVNNFYDYLAKNQKDRGDLINTQETIGYTLSIIVDCLELYDTPVSEKETTPLSFRMISLPDCIERIKLHGTKAIETTHQNELSCKRHIPTKPEQSEPTTPTFK